MTAVGIHAHPTRKLGLIPSSLAARERVIRLPLGTVLPDVPPMANNLAGPQFTLGANDRFGTCWPTSVANHAILTWYYVLGEQVTVTDEDVFDLYRRSGNGNFDPGSGADDNGVDPLGAGFPALMSGGIALTWLDEHGNPDPATRTVVAPVCYGSFDHTSLPDLHAATWATGAAMLGVNLETAQQSQHSLWDYQRSGEWGGHAIIGGAYVAPASPASLDETCITWQEQVGMTDRFLGRQLDMGVGLVWEPTWRNDTFAAGVDRAALAALYQQATGQPIGQPT